jgi:osmotically-inducible protein OsmY
MKAQTEQRAATSRQIATIAEARLGASSHLALRKVLCKFDQGILVLEGHLSTFFQKQLAQEIVAHIEGVERVVNQIEVAGRATKAGLSFRRTDAPTKNSATEALGKDGESQTVRNSLQ